MESRRPVEPLRRVHAGHERVKSTAHIRMDRFFFALFPIALTISGIAQFMVSKEASTAEIIATALGLVALPALVVVPWRLFQRRAGKMTNTPAVAGTILFLIVSGLLMIGRFGTTGPDHLPILTYS